MDTLPEELIYMIVSNVTRKDRQSLARVAPFQIAAESRTFRSIRIKSSELLEFRHIFRYAHRQSALQNLCYTIKLPRYNITSGQYYEGGRTQQINNEVFTRAIIGLFRILNTWNYSASTGKSVGYTAAAGIGLDLYEVSSSSDPTSFDGDSWWDDRFSHHRYKYSYLKMVPVQPFELESIRTECQLALEDMAPSTAEKIEKFTIPTVDRVTSFRVTASVVLSPDHYRKIEPSSIIILAGMMPNLGKLNIDGLSDKETKVPGVRQRIRLEFGLFLLQLFGPLGRGRFLNLKTLDIRACSFVPSNHDYSGSALSPSYPGVDFFSLGLHALSLLPNLNTVVLGQTALTKDLFCISPVLFWRDPKIGTRPPFWPSLKKFLIVISPLAPSGKWYITGDSSNPRPLSYSDREYISRSFPQVDEDNVFDRQVTPSLSHSQTAQDNFDDGPIINEDPIMRYREARLSGSIPQKEYRRELDPETFTPLIIAAAKMIAVARKQRLAQFRLTLDLGGFRRVKHFNPVPQGWEVDPPAAVDFELFFLRRGTTLKGLELTETQQQMQNHDRVIIRAEKELKWSVIQNTPGVKEALREAVGEDGIIRVDTIDLPEMPPNEYEDEDYDDGDEDEDDNDGDGNDGYAQYVYNHRQQPEPEVHVKYL